MKKLLLCFILCTMVGVLSFSTFSQAKKSNVSQESSEQTKKTTGKNKWVKIGKKYKYLKNGTYVKNKIIKINKKYYYFNKKGFCRTGWVKFKGNKYYFNKKKRYAYVGRKKVKSLYYMFDSKGRLVQNEGMYEYKSHIYYLSDKGRVQTGWKMIDNSYHYFDLQNGKMYTGKKTIDNQTHYFTDSGEAYFGVYQEGKKKFYCDIYGTLQIGCMIRDDAATYYADQNGYLLTGLQRIGSKVYYFNDDCEMQTGFVTIGQNKMFFDNNGVLFVKQKFIFEGNTYYADNNGYIVTNRWMDGKFFDWSGKQTDSVIEYTDQDVSFITKEVLDEMDLSSCTKLMIVAHPDDEVLWGGAEVAQGGYFILCLTNGNNATRKAEFMKVLEQSGNKGMILSYPDTVAGVRSQWKAESPKIAHDLDVLMNYKAWGKVVTHNPAGEYGHIHHKLTNVLVTQMYFKNYQLEDLYYFEIHYSKKQIEKIGGTLKRVPSDLLNEKLSLFKIYASQKACVDTHSYLAPYENLINAFEWQ